MALFGRVNVGSSLIRILNKRSSWISYACISTSEKNKDTSITTTTPRLFEDDLPEKFDARVKNKYWTSWGFDDVDREKDATFIHIFFFGFITLCLVGGGFKYAYAPHKNLRDWAQREAYLLIRQREELGLPFVERDLIPADTIQLPSDEELGNTEIII